MRDDIIRVMYPLDIETATRFCRIEASVLSRKKKKQGQDETRNARWYSDTRLQ